MLFPDLHVRIARVLVPGVVHDNVIPPVAIHVSESITVRKARPVSRRGDRMKRPFLIRIRPVDRRISDRPLVGFLRHRLAGLLVLHLLAPLRNDVRIRRVENAVGLAVAVEVGELRRLIVHHVKHHRRLPRLVLSRPILPGIGINLGEFAGKTVDQVIVVPVAVEVVHEREKRIVRIIVVHLPRPLGLVARRLENLVAAP